MCIFNELVIKNTPVEKIRSFLVFMEGFTCITVITRKQNLSPLNFIVTVDLAFK